MTKILIILNIIMVCLIILFYSSCVSVAEHPTDTCPHPEGYSCPLDGSPCPFCGGVQ